MRLYELLYPGLFQYLNPKLRSFYLMECFHHSLKELGKFLPDLLLTAECSLQTAVAKQLRITLVQPLVFIFSKMEHRLRLNNRSTLRCVRLAR